MPTPPAGSHTATATILFTDLVGSTAAVAAMAEAEALGMARESVRFQRLRTRMPT